jgi:hypothetical protein
MASAITAPRNEPMKPLGRSLRPSPAMALSSMPPTNEPARPAMSAWPFGCEPIPKASWASQPMNNPNTSKARMSTVWISGFDRRTVAGGWVKAGRRLGRLTPDRGAWGAAEQTARDDGGAASALADPGPSPQRRAASARITWP